MANESPSEIAKLKQEYLTDAFLFLTYLIKKQEVDDVEEKWQEARRKAMRGR